jgi:hypothetical protein
MKIFSMAVGLEPVSSAAKILWPDTHNAIASPNVNTKGLIFIGTRQSLGKRQLAVTKSMPSLVS